MRSTGFTCWEDGDLWLGYLDVYPNYRTQGTSLAGLKEHLLDLKAELSGGLVPGLA